MPMNRRAILGVLLLIASQGAGAHTPYRQCKVLRERYLLVHSTREDPEGDVLAERIVKVLDRVLPEARAMVARARDLDLLASLLTTGQAVLGIMRSAEAQALYRSQGRFAGMKGETVRVLLAVEDRLLVTVRDLPRHHAWLLASALTEAQAGLHAGVPDYEAPPVHPGAVAFARGESLKAQE
jgi:hypothetical protein